MDAVWDAKNPSLGSPVALLHHPCKLQTPARTANHQTYRFSLVTYPPHMARKNTPNGYSRYILLESPTLMKPLRMSWLQTVWDGLILLYVQRVLILIWIWQFGVGQAGDDILREFHQMIQGPKESFQDFGPNKSVFLEPLMSASLDGMRQFHLKTRFFHGINYHPRDSLCYLYDRPKANFEDLLLTVMHTKV